MRRRPLAERFWEKVARSAGCWVWTGATGPTGYGMIGVDGASRRAHRVAWEMEHGPIPVFLNVLHRCDNPSCVRPAHLFLGTQAANVADMVAKGRRRAVEPWAGTHPDRVGTANPRAILDEDGVRVIRRLRASGSTYEGIAGAVGMSKAAIADIVKGRRWGHVQ